MTLDAQKRNAIIGDRVIASLLAGTVLLSLVILFPVV